MQTDCSCIDLKRADGTFRTPLEKMNLGAMTTGGSEKDETEYHFVKKTFDSNEGAMLHLTTTMLNISRDLDMEGWIHKYILVYSRTTCQMFAEHEQLSKINTLSSNVIEI